MDIEFGLFIVRVKFQFASEVSICEKSEKFCFERARGKQCVYFACAYPSTSPSLPAIV